MRILKKILFVLLGIIAFLLIAAIFISKEYKVEREVTINKPRSEVFAYVKQLKNQQNYGVWDKLDLNMKKEFKGTDGTVGFIYGWNGNKDVGIGEQEIKKIAENERIDLEIRFKEPFESTASIHLVTDSVAPAQTKVKWGMSGKSPYPMNIMNLFMDGMIGKDYQGGLNNLKAILEK